MRKQRPKKSLFYKLTSNTAEAVGSPLASILSFAVIIIWAVTGPIFKFSDTWQLCINTGTTIVTFLMVFLIQNSQNRDSRAVQIKLDELIRASGSAHNEIIDVEESSQQELEKLQKDYAKLRNGSPNEV